MKDNRTNLVLSAIEKASIDASNHTHLEFVAQFLAPVTSMFFSPYPSPPDYFHPLLSSDLASIFPNIPCLYHLPEALLQKSSFHRSPSFSFQGCPLQWPHTFHAQLYSPTTINVPLSPCLLSSEAPHHVPASIFTQQYRRLPQQFSYAVLVPIPSSIAVPCRQGPSIWTDSKSIENLLGAVSQLKGR
jgi:hypothetical protein